MLAIYYRASHAARDIERRYEQEMFLLPSAISNQLLSTATSTPRGPFRSCMHTASFFLCVVCAKSKLLSAACSSHRPMSLHRDAKPSHPQGAGHHCLSITTPSVRARISLGNASTKTAAKRWAF